MNRQEQIATFLDRYVTRLPRCHGYWRYSLADCGIPRAPRPTVEAVAKELLGIAEFRALRLGTWLGTTDGQILAEAVELVVPMFYAEDVALLVEALELAAAMQQREGRQKALAGAAVVLVLGGLGRAA